MLSDHSVSRHAQVSPIRKLGHLRHDPHRPQTFRSRSSFFSRSHQGENMTSCITGSRSRRAAALPLLCAVAIAACANHIAAQEPSYANDAGDDAVVISDDNTAVLPESIENGDYTCTDAYDDYAPCDNCGPCEPCRDDDHCAGWFGRNGCTGSSTGVGSPPWSPRDPRQFRRRALLDLTTQVPRS